MLFDTFFLLAGLYIHYIATGMYAKWVTNYPTNKPVPLIRRCSMLLLITGFLAPLGPSFVSVEVLARVDVCELMSAVVKGIFISSLISYAIELYLF